MKCLKIAEQLLPFGILVCLSSKLCFYPLIVFSCQLFRKTTPILTVIEDLKLNKTSELTFRLQINHKGRVLFCRASVEYLIDF